MFKSHYVPLSAVGAGWIEAHIETFIKPNWGGKVPEIPININPPTDPRAMWPIKTMRVLQACWEKAKERSKGRVILLPGRDTWMFEVLARLDGRETRFIPECSARVWSTIANKDDFSHYYCIDSGNKGSIPVGLRVADWDLVYWSARHNTPPPIGAALPHSYPFPMPHHQLFYNAKIFNAGLYNLYSSLEGHSKYWTRGEVSTLMSITKIHQTIDEHNFPYAAIGTLHVARFALANPLRRRILPTKKGVISMGRGW